VSRGAPAGWPLRAARAALGVLLVTIVAVVAAHGVVRRAVRFEPPRITVSPSPAPGAWTRVLSGLRLVHLTGTPEAIGGAHAQLLRDRMLEDEAQLWSDYARLVPWRLARAGIEDYSRVRYRRLDQALPDARRRELAAEARAFEPDPFAPRIPTYQRMVFLYALYDVALPLEHSPFIGCTTFGLGPAETADGHALVGRAFDLEASDVFDRDKAVFLIAEEGAVPFASVAWPGFVGVVTGMNAEGVLVAVHGARAGEPSSDGLPVAFSLREVLSRARDTAEAVAILAAQRVMVSHMVFVADAAGRFAVVERVPGAQAYVREGGERAAVTNHFEGPSAVDPRNLRVREVTTTLARRARIDELLAEISPRSGTPERALRLLRDHRCHGDLGCKAGDRRAIDALIATHGVIADTTDRVLWVGVGPHLSGRFVRLDLRTLLAADSPPPDDTPLDGMPEDAPGESLR
jgi:hypothetical protein